MKKNILVVDDSALMRRVICDIIAQDSNFEVKKECRNGQEALEALRTDKYDGVLLDVNMPVMDGLQLLQMLQKERIATTVIMVSTLTSRDADITIRALELGAVDFVTKPGSMIEAKGPKFATNLIATMNATILHQSGISDSVSKTIEACKERVSARTTATSSVKTETPARERSSRETPASKTPFRATSTRESAEKEQPTRMSGTVTRTESSVRTTSASSPTRSTAASTVRTEEEPKRKSSLFERLTGKETEIENSSSTGEVFRGKKLIALASSTGGPKALHDVIPRLPRNLSCPMVLVQHMPEGFTKSMADRLNELSQVAVKEAEDGDVLMKGFVYIAPGGRHLRVVYNSSDKTHRIKLSDEPAIGGLRPCADLMYDSLRESGFDEITCVVLTGMGSDGTKGIVSLSEKKKIFTISQDQNTCVVYGMPRAIAETGIVDKVVPLNEVANTIIKNVGVI